MLSHQAAPEVGGLRSLCPGPLAIRRRHETEMRYRNCYRVFYRVPADGEKTNCHLETAVRDFLPPPVNWVITDLDDPDDFEHLLSRCRHVSPVAADAPAAQPRIRPNPPKHQ